MGDEQPLYTGRQIVVFADEVQNDVLAMSEALQSTTGATTIASSLDFARGALDIDQGEAADAMVFAELGVAVLPESAGTAPTITAVMRNEAKGMSPEVATHIAEGLRKAGLREG